jgi:hypothetical protein
MFKILKPGEISEENIQLINRDQVKDADKAEFEAHMK